VSITKSDSINSTNQYSDNSGSGWKNMTDDTVINVSTAGTYPQGKYQAKATKSGYDNSETVNSPAFVVGKPRMYWGVVDTVPTTESGIKSLGNNIKADRLPQSVTIPSSNVQGKNLVFAYNKATIGNVDVTNLNIGGFSYEFEISTVGSFRVCVCRSLAASAAGLTAIFS
jgi:hypothetical protein